MDYKNFSFCITKKQSIKKILWKISQEVLIISQQIIYLSLKPLLLAVFTGVTLLFWSESELEWLSPARCAGLDCGPLRRMLSCPLSFSIPFKISTPLVSDFSQLFFTTWHNCVSLNVPSREILERNVTAASLRLAFSYLFRLGIIC